MAPSIEKLIVRDAGDVFQTGRGPVVLLGAVSAGLLCVLWGWGAAYLTFTVDDSFYYWEIARRFAAGQGATFDGVELTDGYHPLWLWLLSGFAWLTSASPAVGMRMVLSWQVLMVAGATSLLAYADHRKWAKLPTLVALVLLAFYGSKVLINGQESAVQYLLLAATLASTWRAHRDGKLSDWLPVVAGGLAGLCALSRLEAGLLAVGVAYSFLFPLGLPQGWAQRARRASVSLLASGAFLLPYVLGHHSQTGHWGPVSGAIKAGMPSAMPGAVRVLLALIALIAMVWWAVRARTRSTEHQLLPLAWYVFGLQAYLWGVRGVWVPGIWYLVPHFLLVCLIAARVQLRSGVLVRGGMRLGLLVWLSFCVLQWGYRWMPTSYGRYLAAANVGDWIENNVSPERRLAGWDSGIVGAHTTRAVTNLDGLVNSWGYKLNYLDRNQTEQYLAAQNIDRVVQNFRRSWVNRGDFHWRGVDLSDWVVLNARCYEQRVVARFWNPAQQVFLVLARRGTGLRLKSFAGGFERLCQG